MLGLFKSSFHSRRVKYSGGKKYLDGMEASGKTRKQNEDERKLPNAVRSTGKEIQRTTG